MEPGGWRDRSSGGRYEVFRTEVWTFCTVHRATARCTVISAGEVAYRFLPPFFFPPVFFAIALIPPFTRGIETRGALAALQRHSLCCRPASVSTPTLRAENPRATLCAAGGRNP